jgi:2-dehydro-3-deoxyphosphogluconate aldolase/(4S)-4-hydroxy-2-oxoglutarate aldolase
VDRDRTESADATPIKRGVIAVVRTADADAALTLARGLAGTGVVGIELTMTVPDAPKVIEQLVAEGVTGVGAGTVRTLQQVKRCVDAGASFLVSPHLNPRLVETAVDLGVPVVPGALTPSEILHAMRLGAAAVKLFPISAVGGLDYVRAVLEPVPDARFVVSGEVMLSEVAGYLDAGAWAACVGPSLWRHEDVYGGDVEAVRRYAEKVLDQASATAAA